VRIQETMLLKNSSTSFLRILGSCGKFSWNWLSLRGRCVGILGGFCTHRFDIINFSSGKFYIRLVVLDKKINSLWVLVIDYGAAQEEDTQVFYLN
jgi:hypothetical protein